MEKKMNQAMKNSSSRSYGRSKIDLDCLLVEVYLEATSTRFTPPEIPVSENAVAMQIKATTGLGKTRATVELIANDPFLREQEIRFHVPDHELAVEVYELAVEAGLPRIQRIAGRGSAGMCARSDVAEKAANAGLNVYATCCKTSENGREITCPHFNNCPYLEQWMDTEPAFRVLTHEYLFLPTPQPNGVTLPDPKLVVVDESVVAKAIREFSFGVDRLTGRYAKAVKEHLGSGVELGESMRSAGVVDTDTWREADKLEWELSGNVLPDMPDRDALNKIQDIAAAEHRKLATFHRCLAYEVEDERPVRAVRVVKDEKVKVNGQWEMQDRIHVFERRPTRIHPRASLLLLDADADQTLNERLFERKLEAVEIAAKQKAHVVQVYSTALATGRLLKDAESRRGLAALGRDELPNDTLSKVDNIIRTETLRSSRVLVVGPKKLEAPLVELDVMKKSHKRLTWHGAEYAHFGAIRGKNRWKGFDAIVVLGRNEPRPVAIDNQLRGLLALSEFDLELAGEGQFKKEPRGYREATGEQVGVLTSVHPDPVGQKLLEQIRECESTQAIGRLRLVHAEEQKRVVILSSVPLDITVDELVTLDELAGNIDRAGFEGRLRMALERTGVLPLGVKDLMAVFPDIYPSRDRARDDMRDARVCAKHRAAQMARDARFWSDGGIRADIDHSPPHGPGERHIGGDRDRAHRAQPDPAKSNGGKLLIEYLFRNPPHLIAVSYRRSGQRGRASHAIIDTSKHPSPEAALAELLGTELTKFEIKETEND